MVPLKKQSKRQQSEFYASKRNSWNGINPVTRIVYSKKAYDRNQIKREFNQTRTAGE